MEGRQVYIFTPLHQEAKAIRATVARRPDVQVRVIGLRAAALPALEGLSARSIIVAGFGGALERSLAVADVVIDGWPAFDGERWLRFGAIHTADQLAATREQKADLFGQTGALAVDMETAIVRRAAAGVGVPVIAVRAITDTAAHEIDPAMLGLLDDAGRVRGLELMRLLLLRKKTLSQLFRLRAAASIAGARLAQALGLLLDSVQGK